MSSPNEPGPTRAGEGAGTNGSNGPVDAGQRPGAGHGEHAEPPPWQRGATRNRPPQRAADAPSAEGGRGAGGAHSPVDARLNRFMTGGPTAPTAPKPTPTRETDVPGRGDAGARGDVGTRSDAVGRGDASRPESYASELPDLSGSSSRAPQRKSSPTSPEPATRPPGSRATAVRAQAGPVRASMQIRRFDPWSVLKVSVILSVALFFVWMIAVAFLYLVLGGMGVWAKLNSNVGDLLTNASGGGGELVSSSTIFGGAALIGLVNIVLLTAMATCGAFIYNLTTDLVGGIEVTLADRD